MATVIVDEASAAKKEGHSIVLAREAILAYLRERGGGAATEELFAHIEQDLQVGQTPVRRAFWQLLSDRALTTEPGERVQLVDGEAETRT